MYTVAVSREFIAHHFLVGGDWGRENQKHSHHYRIELQLEGTARILCLTLSAGIQSAQLQALTLRIWENQVAWAAYRLER